MNVLEIGISELIPYEFNSRNHSEEQINRIANSIKEFGFNQPIVIDKTKTIIAGHGRYFAAKKLGLANVPIVQKDDLTELQIKAYRILDNKLQNDSSWAFNNLELDLDFLEDAGLNMAEWGLDSLRDLFPEPEVEIKEDDFVACENQDIFIKRGDLIELGPHRVLCGDSTSAKDVSSLLKENKPFLMVTDPPYGVKLDPSWRDRAGLNRLGKANRGSIHYMSGGAEDDRNSWRDAYTLFSGDVAYIWSGDKQKYVIETEMTELGMPLRQTIIWSKMVTLTRTDYLYGHESCLYCVREKKSAKFIGKPGQSTVINPPAPQRLMAGSKEEKLPHPAQKPLECMAFAIRNHLGDIYDPFLGSGTTLIAADQLGRICYGMELSPFFCQVIIERYLKHCRTNNKAFDCRVNGEMLPEEFLNKVMNGKEKTGQAEIHPE